MVNIDIPGLLTESLGKHSGKAVGRCVLVTLLYASTVPWRAPTFAATSSTCASPSPSATVFSCRGVSGRGGEIKMENEQKEEKVHGRRERRKSRRKMEVEREERVQWSKNRREKRDWKRRCNGGEKAEIEEEE